MSKGDSFEEMTAEQYRERYGDGPVRLPGKPRLRGVGQVDPNAARLIWELRAVGIGPIEPEYYFDPRRNWHSDLYLPAVALIVEVEGGAWTGGRHTDPVGFLADIDKYNAMTLAGIRLLRVTPQMVESGEARALVEKAVKIFTEAEH